MFDFEIAIYGCGVDASKFSDYFNKMHLGTIQNYIQTKKTFETFRGIKVISVEEVDWDEFDYIVIASSKFVDEIRENIYTLCPEEYKNKVIYMLDFINGKKNLNDKYSVCSVEGNLHFVFNSTDTVIGPWMWLSGKTDGAEVLDYLFDFTDKRDLLNRNGVFLDIGANIGTASIYAKHKQPFMDVISFEPGEENFRMLRTNCMLNDMDSIRLENIGLGSENQNRNYVYKPENPGISRATNNLDIVTETITIYKLDDYVSEQSIDASRIAFIWMDVEGSECDAIIGGEKTLMSHRIPMVHEFNYELYEKSAYRKYLEIMKNCYDSFIDVREAVEGNEKIYPIEELEIYADQLVKQTDLFFF